MSNWVTGEQRVLEEIHRTDPKAQDYAKRGLAHAIGYYSYEDFWFNRAVYDFVTTAGTFEYGEETIVSDVRQEDGYPADFLKVRDMSLLVSNSFYEMSPIPVKTFRRDQVSDAYRGYPKHWVFDHKVLMLDPTPNGAYTVRMDYTSDIGTPLATYDGSSWSYSVDGVEIVDSYSNDWFLEALDLIVERAKWFVFSKITHDMEEAFSAKSAEHDEWKRIKIKTEQTHVPADAVPWG